MTPTWARPRTGDRKLQLLVLERVSLHVDLTILVKLSGALAMALEPTPLAA